MCFRLASLAALFLVVCGLPAAVRTDNPQAARTVVRADRRTGKLVRRVLVPETVVKPVLVESAVVAARTVSAASPATHAPAATAGPMIEQISLEQGVDPLLVHALIHVESRYNQYAISPKGAEGLMQLIPSTARQMGVRNSFDTRQNVEGGVKYLRQLMGQFDDLRHVLAAYNAGPGAVTRWRGIPPYAETQDYVHKVGKRYGELRRAQTVRQAAAAAVPAPPQPAEPEYRPLESHIDEQGRLHLRTR
jgi:soluble lytic murein transglycosylase-like protein